MCRHTKERHKISTKNKNAYLHCMVTGLLSHYYFTLLVLLCFLHRPIKLICWNNYVHSRNDYDDVNNFDPTGTDEGANNNLECQGDDNNIQKCKKNGKKNSLKNEELYSHKTKKLTNRKSGNSKCTKFQCEKKNPLENMKLQNKHGRKQKNELSSDLVFNISDARLMSYGINPKKLKNKMKFSMGK